MSLPLRLQQFGFYLVWTAVFLVVSRVGFDLLAGRPMFWSSREGLETLLWNSLIGGPFIFFALLVSAQRSGIGK
jgi:hypothetical protein